MLPLGPVVRVECSLVVSAEWDELSLGGPDVVDDQEVQDAVGTHRGSSLGKWRRVAANLLASCSIKTLSGCS